MKYSDDGWTGIDGRRRSFRDAYRDVFFNAFDGERLNEPFLMGTDLRQQLQLVGGFIEQAAAFHGDENTALRLLQQVIDGLGFGSVAAPLEAEESVLAFGKTRIASLFEHFDNFVGRVVGRLISGE